MKVLWLAVFLFFCLAFSEVSQAVEPGTKAEAVALASKAAELFTKSGEAEAIATLNAGGVWKDRDLYVVVIDEKGVCLANSNVLALVGKNILALKDMDGKYLIKEMLKIRKTGWVDYKWPSPLTKQVASKSSYVIRMGRLLVFVGAYQ